MANILKKIFGSKHERDVKKLRPIVEAVNELEPMVKKMTEEDMKAKTEEFRQRLQEGAKINDLMAEAFALVREASIRTLEMRHFDVQIMGGAVLASGQIAEMKTGEGKTLVATLPIYLHALTGKPVHLVTVNDYLARRDTDWMRPVYEYLGMTVGCIQHGLSTKERRYAYSCDISYGTNNELGFDYLRDNMVIRKEDKVQRGHYFCIIDEVDSILIDEARTPLIISGPAEESTDKYYKLDKIIPRLTPAVKGKDGKWVQDSGDYQLEEKDRNVTLTEVGIAKIERLLGVDNLYGNRNLDLVHHINQALKAHTLFKRDVDYVVESNEVIIIDEFTNRKMPGRRYSDGLHQALEAKERVPIERENQTLATITFQNYFRMYDVLSGMTGTADTEAEEFRKIYELEVVVIPTNVPCVREDASDRIYRTEREKLNAIVNDIETLHKKGSPILVGTVSIEKSEKLSKILKRKGVPHNVLNAKQHEKEATIVKTAGNKGAVTVATNMAGRGTDIKINDEIRDLGGLHIIGTERHEARRIDNQLRGRSGRQGDPGFSRFYLSLEDDLLRLFAPQRITPWLDRMGFGEGQEIEHKWITKSIATAQRKVETRNFEIRKHLLEYDDVLNQQRKIIYEMRNKVLYNDDISSEIDLMIDDVIGTYILTNYQDVKTLGQEEIEEIAQWLKHQFDTKVQSSDIASRSTKKEDAIDVVVAELRKAYEKRENDIGAYVVRQLERAIMLNTIDTKWKDHLYSLEYLKEGINWRSYAEKNPLVEYKIEGSLLFEEMLFRLKSQIVENLFKVRIEGEVEEDEFEDDFEEPAFVETKHEAYGQFDSLKAYGSDEGTGGAPSTARTSVSTGDRSQTIVKPEKVGRNQPCPCGSGKKYKHCCGR